MSLFKKILGGSGNQQASAPPPAPKEQKSTSRVNPGSLIACDGIEWNKEEQLEFLRSTLTQHSEKWDSAKSDLPQGNQLDLQVLYSIIAHYQPTRLMQVGCGQSTTVMRRALQDYNLPAELITIDPDASTETEQLADAHLDQPVWEVPVSDFEMLRDNELLLIDSSHIYAPGNDVAYLYQHVLPRLNSGVIVGIQGISLPREYDAEKLERGYNEQALLQMFLTNNSRAKIFYAHAWLSENRGGALPNIDLEPQTGGALWLRLE